MCLVVCRYIYIYIYIRLYVITHKINGHRWMQLYLTVIILWDHIRAGLVGTCGSSWESLAGMFQVLSIAHVGYQAAQLCYCSGAGYN